MAKFVVIEASPGQGKSLWTAKQIKYLVKRNKKAHAKYNIPIRRVMVNQKMSEAFEKEAGDFLGYWTSDAELINLRDVDIVWDEIATHLDARKFSELSQEMMRFLSQYRKRGLEIYANTQDFSMIDARARLMITGVWRAMKLCGSPDPSPTLPPIKRIWGIIILWKIENFKELDENKKQYSLFGSTAFMFNRFDVELYDTRQDIKRGKLPPLMHEERFCEVCHKIHVIHK